MNLIRYRKVRPSKLVNELDQYYHLGAYDKEKIKEFFEEHCSFTIIEFPEKEKQNPLWRLSGIFFLILGALMFCTMPFKWVITGRASYDYDGKLYRFLTAWSNKLDF